VSTDKQCLCFDACTRCGRGCSQTAPGAAIFGVPLVLRLRDERGRGMGFQRIVSLVAPCKGRDGVGSNGLAPSTTTVALFVGIILQPPAMMEDLSWPVCRQINIATHN
jgi:hypothetical protein